MPCRTMASQAYLEQDGSNLHALGIYGDTRTLYAEIIVKRVALAADSITDDILIGRQTMPLKKADHISHHFCAV